MNIRTLRAVGASKANPRARLPESAGLPPAWHAAKARAEHGMPVARAPVVPGSQSHQLEFNLTAVPQKSSLQQEAKETASLRAASAKRVAVKKPMRSIPPEDRQITAREAITNCVHRAWVREIRGQNGSFVATNAMMDHVQSVLQSVTNRLNEITRRKSAGTHSSILAIDEGVEKKLAHCVRTLRAVYTNPQFNEEGLYQYYLTLHSVNKLITDHNVELEATAHRLATHR